MHPKQPLVCVTRTVHVLRVNITRAKMKLFIIVRCIQYLNKVTMEKSYWNLSRTISDSKVRFYCERHLTGWRGKVSFTHPLGAIGQELVFKWLHCAQEVLRTESSRQKHSNVEALVFLIVRFNVFPHLSSLCLCLHILPRK